MKSESRNLVPLSIAASDLGIQSRELRKEVESGGLPHVRVGERTILVDLDLIRGLLCERASNQVAGNSDSPDGQVEASGGQDVRA